MKKQKIAILYGVGEGDYHGRRFIAELKKEGFDVVRDAAKADIVITHSGGCFFLPKLSDHQKYILINPPYWPGKSLTKSTVQKVSIDFMDFVRTGKIVQWCWKTVINIAHILRYIIKFLTITLHAHRQRFYEALKDEQSFIIRSERDTFLAPNADRLLEQKVGRVIPMYTGPGQHDTCWRNPAPYIEIIQRIVKA